MSDEQLIQKEQKYLSFDIREISFLSKNSSFKLSPLRIQTEEDIQEENEMNLSDDFQAILKFIILLVVCILAYLFFS